MLLFSRFLLGLVLLPTPILAGVTRVELESQSAVLDGRSFGLVGAYEAFSGKLHFAVNPSNAANRIITDIDLAPRNAQGEVEFSSDFFLLRPKDMARANGALLVDIPNRGGKTALGMFNRSSRVNSPRTAEHYGDGFLLREGFTVLFLGWQFDPPREQGRMRLYTPTASQDGKPIRGLVRADFVVTDRVRHHILSDRDHIPYEVADPAASENVLTVRDSVEAERLTIPRREMEVREGRGRQARSGSYARLSRGGI